MTVDIASRETLDIEQIQAAIRARIAARDAGLTRPDRLDHERRLVARTEPLASDWDFPADVWAAMWPPNLAAWNLDQDFPIRSHRGVLGAALVLVKRAQRALLGHIAKPLLVQQALINRTLAQMSRTLSDELTEEQQRVRLLEQRLARVSSVLADLRGDGEPLVTFVR